MELLSLLEAQKSLDQLLKCPGLRCVLDSFADGVSKGTREDIYVFFKDGGGVRVERLCDRHEKPRTISDKDVCYVVSLKKVGEVQVLWRNEKGQWRLSNASKRPLSPSEKGD